MVDAIVSYIDSSGYSYWSSDLNETTRIAPYSNHFPYSVTLSTKGQNISWLPTRVPFLIPQNTKTWCPTLYYFRSLFNDHRRPISWIKELSLFISGKSVGGHLPFTNTCRTDFPDLFHKTKKGFSNFQIFLKLFLLRGSESNWRPLGYEPNELPLLLPRDIIEELLYNKVPQR